MLNKISDLFKINQFGWKEIEEKNISKSSLKSLTLNILLSRKQPLAFLTVNINHAVNNSINSAINGIRDFLTQITAILDFSKRSFCMNHFCNSFWLSVFHTYFFLETFHSTNYTFYTYVLIRYKIFWAKR